MNKLILILGAITLLASTAMLFSHEKPALRAGQAPLDAKLIEEWKQYKLKFPRTFNDVDLEVYRMKVFANNLRYIKETNANQNGFTLALNQFADMTQEEFKNIILGTKPELKTKAAPEMHVNDGLTLGDVDWRDKGAVQQVKDQGQCGSCWAFSAVGSMESDDFVEKGQLGNFSEQQLVDCSTTYGNMGCNGGLMDYAFDFVKDNGITDETSYPYTARDGSCKQQGGDWKIRSYVDIAAGNCDDLKNAVTQQPTSVAVDALNWQFYSGGVFSNCGSQLDHGVLAVGFKDGDDGFWIIKNSWSTGWGEQGYIRLAMGNTCGICNMSSYPRV